MGGLLYLTVIWYSAMNLEYVSTHPRPGRAPVHGYSTNDKCSRTMIGKMWIPPFPPSAAPSPGQLLLFFGFKDEEEALPVDVGCGTGRQTQAEAASSSGIQNQMPLMDYYNFLSCNCFSV